MRGEMDNNREIEALNTSRSSFGMSTGRSEAINTALENDKTR